MAAEVEQVATEEDQMATKEDQKASEDNNLMKFETFDISFYHDTLNQLNHDLKAASASPEQMLQLVQMCQPLFYWAANSSLRETDVNLQKIMLSMKFARSDHSSSGTHHNSLY